MNAADRAAVAAGAQISELMERAGAAVAAAARERFPGRSVCVLAGPGDNGGDAYVAARILGETGVEVTLEALSPPASTAAKAAATRWGGKALSLGERSPKAGLVIDALFGAGLNRPLPPEAARLARTLARSGTPVLAVDVPSGLLGDTARPLGAAAFKAELTVTFHRRKLAHVLEPGRSLCGEIVVADIGLGAVSARLYENRPALWLPTFPWPGAETHKHSRGSLIVVSGEAWSTGAARLAARAGLRVGAGLVTILSPPDALAVNAAHLEAVMLRPFETETELEAAASRVESAVIGPAAGVSEATLSNVLALARTGAALVVDADALTVFRDEPEELFSALDRDDVLTPHPGEFDRVFPGLLKGSPERVTAARTAAAKAEAVVLLKGPDTVVAAADGRAAVNLDAPPWLATAGSGDVLAGLIGGLLAQGMESFAAACAAAWIHGRCAALHGAGLISEDLPGLVPSVMKELQTRVGVDS
ncbi:MAG TPA: NAD(P)H-hydrate dehydratase [Caulobacteraceae bacterium]|nr:NAD(P)H-hydrate dehydratase [Caulobacteraceae bacterium]